MNTPIQVSRLNFINLFDNPLISLLKYVSFGIGAACLLLIGYSLIYNVQDFVISIAAALLSPAIVFYSLNEYVAYLKKHPKYLISQINRKEIENNFDYKALAMFLALKNKGWKALWKEACRSVLVNDFLMRFGVTRGNISSYFPKATPTDEELKQLLLLSATYGEGNLISSFVFLGAVFSMPQLKIVLDKERITPSDLHLLVKYYIEIDEERYSETPLTKSGGIGKDLASSYTNVLDRFTTVLDNNISYYVKKNPILSRNSYVDQLVLELNRGEVNSVVITGNPGTGKTEIFYHLADKIVNYKTKTALDGYSVRMFDTAHFIQAVRSNGEAEKLVSVIFQEIIKNKQTVIFIDDIHLLLDKSEQKGTVNLQSVLLPYFQNSEVRIVGATNAENYIKFIKSDPQLSSALPNLELPMPNISDRLVILLSQIHKIEYEHKVFFMFEAIKTIVELADRYLNNEFSPEREIRLAQKNAVRVNQAGSALVSAEDVQQSVEQISGVPITIKEDDKQTLLNLEEKLHERVVGQHTAIKEITNALIRSRSGMSSASKPIGTFLFLGPTGVGKTETAKALCEIYFGDSSKMVRLDMAEYADTNALQKLLGVSAEDPGKLALMISQNPSSVVLLDEIEKANELTKNALLRLLDEGKITTNFGKVLDFTNTIIIATSNAGSQFIREAVNNNDLSSKKLVDFVINNNSFSPEFLNRFDAVIMYLPLNQDEVEQIVKLRVSKIINDFKQSKGIDLSVSDEVISAIAQKGYDPSFGARALNRELQQTLETQIARKILEQNITSGGTVVIDKV